MSMLEPFKIAFADDVLQDLAARLLRARLAPGADGDWHAGTNPMYLRELIAYWRGRFDWRTQEVMLNRFQHFRCEIDGTRIHLIHEKGRGPAPLPLILTHGYPDSFFRFYKLIPLLADPAAHGGDADDAFDVVVPSLPGYGFSEAREQKGGLFGFHDVFHTLMTREMGYRRFGAHGGDWGSTVT
jgi:microsomal epoxide hydrolase